MLVHKSCSILLLVSLILLVRADEVIGNENDYSDTGSVYTFQFRYNNNNMVSDGSSTSRRNLQFQSSTPLPHFDASMSGGALYIDLYVGNPAQKQTLAISIAGDFVAFPCVVRTYTSRCEQLVVSTKESLIFFTY
jgi:hypothetical protein